MGKIQIYTAFGLNISSDIELSLLRANTSGPYDICFARGNVSKSGLEGAAVIRPHSQTSPNVLWFHAPGIAWFYVTGGSQVVYEPEKGADEQSIRLYLLGTCMGALMHQRNRLVIHGNAVRIGGECVVFAGISGNGKSTLATALYQKGYQLLADDLAVIDEHYQVLPSYPQIKLWRNTADKLGIDVSLLSRIRPQIEKYVLPLTHGFCDQALPIKAVYILSTHNQDTFEFNPIRGVDKFILMKNQTYRVGHLEGLGLRAQHLKLCAQLADRTVMTRIVRPRKGFALDKLVNLIEEDMQKNGIAA